MWTWSISASGSKNLMLREVAAMSLPTAEYDLDGKELRQIERDPAELDQFDLAKLDIIERIRVTRDNAGVAVSCSGNATTFKASVKQIGDPNANVGDLITSVQNAGEGLERNPEALQALKQLILETEERIAAKEGK